MISTIIKIIFLVFLIFLDCIIYLLPTYILSLALNFFVTLIWYLPSIYQFYSFVFTTNEYDLRVRIYLLLFSPIIIILYIPFFITYSIGYGIFFSLVNPLITIIQRPEYPFYSLSLTAAIMHLIYKYILSGCPVEEILIDSLILEKIKDVTHFTKRYWHFHSIKFSEKIKHPKLYVCKLISLLISYILDFSIIFLILIMIIVPYIIMFILIWSICVSAHVTFTIIHDTHNKFYYFILIITIPFVFFCIFVIANLYGYYLGFKEILNIFYIYKIFKLYKNNNGFYDMMGLFWVFIIIPFLKFKDSIYVYFRINIRYNQELFNLYNSQ